MRFVSVDAQRVLAHLVDVRQAFLSQLELAADCDCLHMPGGFVLPRLVPWLSLAELDGLPREPCELRCCFDSTYSESGHNVPLACSNLVHVLLHSPRQLLDHALVVVVPRPLDLALLMLKDRLLLGTRLLVLAGQGFALLGRLDVRPHFIQNDFRNRAWVWLGLLSGQRRQELVDDRVFDGSMGVLVEMQVASRVNRCNPGLASLVASWVGIDLI